MRKQIAAANWKMNGTFQQGERLLDDILGAEIELANHQLAIFAVPFPYLLMTRSEVEEEQNYYAAAQNCHHKKSGAYTGEVSAEMLHSMNINYCVVGHSERREYNAETNAMLADKVNLCFEHFITPLFCCGEALAIREAGTQNDFVAAQLKESLFHLPADKIKVAEIKTGSTGNVDKAIDSAIATLSPKGVLEMTLEALRTTLSAYQGMETLSGNLGGEKGFHNALLLVKQEISESDLPFLIKKPSKKSGIPLPQSQSSSDKSCPFDADVCLYDSQLINEYTKVQTDRQLAYSTLNGATERRNLTEARYNACKAAYEAAEAARKG